MTAQELNDYLVSLVKVDIKDSVDRVIVGDPQTRVRKIGTCWLPYWDTLKEAARKGVNVIVTHEPTFYHHFDLQARDRTYPEQIRAKRKWILDHRMVIIRTHDMMDAAGAPFGIPFAWGGALGFKPSDMAWTQKYMNVYSVRPAKARAVARRLARRLAAMHQPGVAFYGDPDRTVRTVGVGTGCYADPKRMRRKPDLFVAVDDSIFTWCQTTYSKDTGYPLVVVNHGTSEEAGMMKLRDHLAATFPRIACLHFPQGCTYDWISGV